jgi:hypothetical protein
MIKAKLDIIRSIATEDKAVLIALAEQRVDVDPVAEALLDLVEDAVDEVRRTTAQAQQQIEQNRKLADHTKVWLSAPEANPRPVGHTHDLELAAERVAAARQQVWQQLRVLDLHIDRTGHGA